MQILHESECDMSNYSTSTVTYFYEPEASKSNSANEISCLITLMSVKSGLLNDRYFHCSSYPGLVSYGVKLALTSEYEFIVVPHTDPIDNHPTKLTF